MISGWLKTKKPFELFFKRLFLFNTGKNLLDLVAYLEEN